MKNVSIRERLERAKPFTVVEIYFRLNKQVETFDLYSVSEATRRFNKCATITKLMIDETGFSAEISCRALRYGDTWTHVKQLIINQKIA